MYIVIILGTEPDAKWIRFTLFFVQLLPSDNADSAKMSVSDFNGVINVFYLCLWAAYSKDTLH